MIAYLTQMHIDYELAVKRNLRDSYAWHQKIWEAFPGREKGERNFLTRVDDTNDGFRILVLSQSEPTRPDWCPDAPENWRVAEVPDTFLDHDHFRFSLLANATIKKVVRNSDGVRKKNGRRVAIINHDQLKDWLFRKGEQHGFTVNPSQFEIESKPRQYFVKNGKSGLHRATEFKGTLEITDKALFIECLTNGVGPGKAFGYGLFCLSPVSSTH